MLTADSTKYSNHDEDTSTSMTTITVYQARNTIITSTEASSNQSESS